MKVKDVVNNIELDLNRDDLIQKMKDGRQVDLILKEKKSDDIGAVEHFGWKALYPYLST